MIAVIWYIGIAVTAIAGFAWLIAEGYDDDGRWMGVTAILLSWAWPLVIPLLVVGAVVLIYKFCRWYYLNTIRMFNEMRS